MRTLWESSALRVRVVVVSLALVSTTGSMPVYSSTNHRPFSPASESIVTAMTFAADCTTPKTTFNLGETVCAQVTGGTGLRLQWVNADGFAVAMSSISDDPQTSSFVLPASDQSFVSGVFLANNLGSWRINVVTSRNSVNTSAFFVVRDPNNPKVDLSIVKSLVGTDAPLAGAPFQYAIRIVNNGPDDAVNTHFVDSAYTNATFNSLSQIDGPSFTCTGAGVDCHIASFPNGAVATFVLNFTAGSDGGVIENTATVSSDTPELNPKDNSSSTSPITVAGNGGPPQCDLMVTAPPAVTLFTGPGATTCSVIVTDLDATLGTGTATGSCSPEAVTRSGVPAGNEFPVGMTAVTYSATDTQGDTASAIQSVTVIDNTPPAITCPAKIILEPTCPAGAIAAWTAPAATDNCGGVSTVQIAGPASGSVFPIGTTSVTDTATDSAGNHASCSFTVTVLTPATAIQNVEASVNASSLTGPQKQGLLPKLDAALSALNRGSTNAACNTLQAFVNQVETYISTGKISAAEGEAWITLATHIGNAIGCTSNPCS